MFCAHVLHASKYLSEEGELAIENKISTGHCCPYYVEETGRWSGTAVTEYSPSLTVILMFFWGEGAVHLDVVGDTDSL